MKWICCSTQRMDAIAMNTRRGSAATEDWNI
jgi:hypothetical protein